MSHHCNQAYSRECWACGGMTYTISSTRKYTRKFCSDPDCSKSWQKRYGQYQYMQNDTWGTEDEPAVKKNCVDWSKSRPPNLEPAAIADDDDDGSGSGRASSGGLVAALLAKSEAPDVCLGALLAKSGAAAADESLHNYEVRTFRVLKSVEEVLACCSVEQLRRAYLQKLAAAEAAEDPPERSGP